MRCVKILLFVLCLFLAGCIREKADEAVLKRHIGVLLARYQQGVNELDSALLESVISDQFSFYAKGRTEYIRELLIMTTLIDRVAYSNIRIENYKIFADVKTEGSVIYRPEVELPLFQNIPFMNGRLTKYSIFAFMYETEDGLKILAEEPVLAEEAVVWGERPPVILQPELSRRSISPGENLEVSFQVAKPEGDIIFVFVNDQLLGGYALDEHINEGINYTLKTPAGLKRGDNFKVRLLALGGRVDLNNPQAAELAGAAVQTYILPVR
ncbi:MAG: hypothetical protein LBD99_01110 [Candidatus Margulisbacteria bacterium]|jgi:hypothetical protein|nr:hypothetical protein [Candidatus Margulisiibacteriota bacterium]